MHLSLRYRNALHLANTPGLKLLRRENRLYTKSLTERTVTEKNGLDREFKNCSPFSLSMFF